LNDFNDLNGFNALRQNQMILLYLSILCILFLMRFLKNSLLLSIGIGLVWVIGHHRLSSLSTSTPPSTEVPDPAALSSNAPISAIRGDAGSFSPISKLIPLISGGEYTDVPWTSRTPAAKRVRRIFPDPNLLTARPVLNVGDSIQLALFEDAIFEAIISNVTCYPNGAVGMTAHCLGIQGTIYLSYCARQMRVSVEVMGGANYYVRYNSEQGEHYAIEVNRENSDIRPCGDLMIPPFKDAQADAPTPEIGSDPIAPSDAPSGSTVIDVMIVYTPKALSDEGGLTGMNNNIGIAMQKANEAHTNSNTQIYLNLVHSAWIDYVESGDDNTDLDRLTETSDRYMDDVHTLRDTYGADFVCLFSDTASVGGKGWLNLNSNGDDTKAFCLAWNGQTDTGYTLVHEWGHNMGCSHSKSQTSQPWTNAYYFRSYSAGWQWSDAKPSSPKIGYCSVMTYEDHDHDGTREYERAAHFSNPNISYVGDRSHPTGHANDGDNARTLREMKTIYAAYRDPPARIQIEETNLVFTAVAGETDAVSRVISNTGSTELTFVLSDDNLPDLYSWKDSDDVGGPTYAWIDISTEGTLVALTDDGKSSMLSMGFNFPFYGNTYHQFQIAANGVVSLSAGNVDSLNFSLPLPSVYSFLAPSQSFCMFWDNLNPESFGSILYKNQSNRLVVSYINVPRYGTSDQQTFQLILTSDGRILYQYKTLNGDLSSCTVGMMDDHSSGAAVQVVYNVPHLKNNLAMEFQPPQPRWIGYSITNGTTGAYDSTSLEFTADASALTVGDYDATLTITHNDTSRSAIEIPIKFHVIATPNGDVDDDGLPDDWETQHFGSTHINPTATASNGVNTVWQAYIIGLDPTDPDVFFLISDYRSLMSGHVLQWNSTSGRIYSVYSTSNLLENFQPLATNILFPQSSYTDVVDRITQFYKMDVRME